MVRRKTIRHGQRVAVWDVRGRHKVVDGPRRLWLWRRTVEELPRFTAGNYQYLAVHFQNGQVEHLRGPAAVWWDPAEHERIETAKMIALDANEALVVYRQEAKGVHRRLLHAAELDHQKADCEQVGFLGAIRNLHVDLTRYLAAQHQHPDRLIRVDGDHHAQLHLHE